MTAFRPRKRVGLIIRQLESTNLRFDFFHLLLRSRIHV